MIINFRKNIILVHSIIICAFLFPTTTLVNALLNLTLFRAPYLSDYFKEG